MIDREKVIHALEVCSTVQDLAPCPNECPYHKPDAVCYGTARLMQDALALLREQEPAAANWQDQTDLDDIYLSWRCSRCGHCSPSETRYNYCPYCGAKMGVSGDA